MTLRDKRLGIARVSPPNSHPLSCLSSRGWRVYELQRLFISGSGLSWTCHGWPVMSVVSPDFYSATYCKCLLQQQQEEDRKHAQISHFSLKQLPELSSGFPYLGFTLDLPFLKNRFPLGTISSGKREERQREVDLHPGLYLPFVFLPSKPNSSSSNVVCDLMCPCFASVLQLSRNTPF